MIHVLVAGAPFSFTAHNVELPDGTRTMNGTAPVLATTEHCRAALRSLALLCPPPARVVDLGCLEGGYAAELARAGYEVLGIDGRQENIEKCEFVKEGLALPNLGFVCDDVRNVAQHGTFDGVFCAGLLYHLDKPVTFLRVLGEVTRRVLIVQTHYAPKPRNRLRELAKRAKGMRTPHALSPLSTNEGKLGRWYVEWAPDATAEEAEADVWASVGNRLSFWLDKDHLLQAIREAGFPVVYEQYDFLDDIVEDSYIEDENRSLFLGVKL